MVSFALHVASSASSWCISIVQLVLLVLHVHDHTITLRETIGNIVCHFQNCYHTEISS